MGTKQKLTLETKTRPPPQIPFPTVEKKVSLLLRNEKEQMYSSTVNIFDQRHPATAGAAWYQGVTSHQQHRHQETQA